MAGPPSRGRREMDVPSATLDPHFGNFQTESIEHFVADVFRHVLAPAECPDAAPSFDLGGGSVQAMRVLSRIATVFNVRLPLRALSDSPTSSGLTAAIRAARPASNSGAIRVTASGARASTLSFSQERMWFMHALASASAAYHVPIALRLRGHVDTRALQAALDRVVQRHETLRTTFFGYSSGVSARIATSGSVHLSEVVFH